MEIWEREKLLWKLTQDLGDCFYCSVDFPKRLLKHFSEAFNENLLCYQIIKLLLFLFTFQGDPGEPGADGKRGLTGQPVSFTCIC